MGTGPTKQPTITELGEAGQASCRAIIQILDRVGDKWAIMVIGALANGPMRFNAMKRAIIGVSHRMLTLTLRGLERDGLVVRRAFLTIPPKVEYELTPLGHSLIDPLCMLVRWVQSHQPEIEAARSVFDAQQTTEQNR
ncbi:helix-turn-helix domain-containing protein [Trinickia caryophylli]|uniref:Transcriptional regulator, HxlR family n=1 Tax=Trinickia caryophylli TaxID=28094 RepID=A0A1X7H8P7_TRICW|nr:helix-turn-helix domain-containing protein [Trinickia caryophylli]PMS09490.1 transcriptional regulator [Trinickia caryophylli]TRX14077.1 helix-turn-helix transcriptional regulator [Trinickia caryophylli]WQE13897.1 helix-turn-helix domain-containing protein [Trinickia caryophylli]SMF81507.1 transcriptional regulator, HxlR family [Trinickia caryophylli]GLU35761.1 transcriptional regulator [Trinickia caryophylli]